MREKSPYSEVFWSVSSRIGTEYGEIQNTSPQLFQMREKTDQKNSKFGHFLRSVQSFTKFVILIYEIKQKKNFYGKFVKFSFPVVEIFSLVGDLIPGTSEILLKCLTFLRYSILQYLVTRTSSWSIYFVVTIIPFHFTCGKRNCGKKWKKQKQRKYFAMAFRERFKLTTVWGKILGWN